MVKFCEKIMSGQRGQALVETAIAVPLLLVLVLGIVDLGKAFNYSNDLTHLANEAARYATVNYCVPDGSGGCKVIEQAVKDDAESAELRSPTGGGSIQAPGVKIEICLPGGQRVEAKATARYTFLPFVLGNFSKTITARATMYREQ